MTIETFKTLNEDEKTRLIFDANKIAEETREDVKSQLFRIDNFYIEARTSITGKFKRRMALYTLNDLPSAYALEVIKMPTVVGDLKLDDQTKPNEEEIAAVFVNNRTDNPL